MNNNNDYYLQITDVYKAYADKVILDNIDLSVQKGEFCSLVGPSGCGKSTLLRLIMGEETPSRGELHLDGKAIGAPGVDKGIVFQRYSLYPHLSVLDNVSLGLHLGGRPGSKSMSKSQIYDEALEILKQVRLDKHLSKYPHELSGGMQQRVAIAQALIMKPKILLMDEPFGALDPDTREDMQLSLIELWEQEQMTIFFVTHDLEEAAFLGTRLLVLSQYYTDDRKVISHRGSKVVVDQKLSGMASATSVKQKKEFTELLKSVREKGFSPDYLQHARDFDLHHPDAFSTLTEQEDQQDS